MDLVWVDPKSLFHLQSCDSNNFQNWDQNARSSQMAVEAARPFRRLLLLLLAATPDFHAIAAVVVDVGNCIRYCMRHAHHRLENWPIR
jgi:hypothetical protein